MTNQITSLATETCEEAYVDANAFFDYINSNDVVNSMLDKMAPSYDERDTELTNFFGAKAVPFRLTCQNGMEVK